MINIGIGKVNHNYFFATVFHHISYSANGHTSKVEKMYACSSATLVKKEK